MWTLRTSKTLFVGIAFLSVVLALFTACASGEETAPLDLSATRPSLLFFYTDN
jgi:hypothetical protein